MDSKGNSVELTAEKFVKGLQGHDAGVRMGDIFALAKTYRLMEPSEIRRLLHNPSHEVRVGAVSIMDFQARDKKTSAE